MNKGRRAPKPGGESGAAPGGGGWGKIKLTAIVGALGVVVTVLTQANQVIEQGKKFVASVRSAPADDTKDSAGPGAPGFQATVGRLDTVPYSLANVTSTHEFLHWLWLAADNREPQSLHVAVEVEVADGPARRNTVTAGEYMVPARGRIAQAVQPNVEFINTDFRNDQPLKLIWRVRTTEGPPRRLATGTFLVPVLPRDVVPWGLRSANGQDVPRDFLVASLAAWVYTPERSIEQRAHEIVTRVGAVPDERLRLRRFMQRTYEGLFPSTVQVQTHARPFPPSSQEVVRTPASVLSGHRATALEAALLMAAHRAALGEDLRGRLVLLALPAGAQAPDPKVFLLAWAIDDRDWEAIELNQADKPFEPNHAVATTRARAVLEERPDLRSALDTSGVYVGSDQKVVALRFRRAQKHFGIRPLP